MAKKNAIQDNQELVYVNRSSKSSLGSFSRFDFIMCWYLFNISKYNYKQ